MQQMPNWDLYWTFLHVIRHGSLSAAARELGLTQPTVGRHIDTLEDLIGAQLFTRIEGDYFSILGLPLLPLLDYLRTRKVLMS